MTTNSQRFSVRQKVAVTVGAFVTGIVFPFVVALCTSQFSINEELSNQLDEGRALYRGIGYRYFVLMMNLPDENDAGTAASHQAIEIYRATLADIQEDMRLLRTNPIYGEIQEQAIDLLVVQNFLVAASISGIPREHDPAIDVMCNLYLADEEWMKPPPGLMAAVPGFARFFAGRINSRLGK